MNKVFFYIKPFNRFFPQLNMQIENEALLKIPNQWDKNKEKMLEILKKAPIIGVYKDESP